MNRQLRRPLLILLSFVMGLTLNKDYGIFIPLVTSVPW